MRALFFSPSLIETIIRKPRARRRREVVPSCAASFTLFGKAHETETDYSLR